MADEYEAVLTDNRQLRDRVLELDEKVTEYRNMEKTLRDTLLTAERVMAEARENARKEAELILRDAKVQSQQEAQNLTARTEALRNELRELRSQRDAFLARMRSLAESQIGLMESYQRDFHEDDRRTDPRRSPEAGPRPLPPAPDPDPVAEEDQWRSYQPGPEPDAEPGGPGPRAQAGEEQTGSVPRLDSEEAPEADVAATVAEMAEAAGAQPGHPGESVRPSLELGADDAESVPAAAESPVEDAPGTEERESGSRWSIARFTRGLGDI